MTTELTLPERAALALGTAKHEKELIELAEQSRSITEIKNKDAREQCHSTAMVLKTRRTSIRKAGKDARDDATKFSKAVIAEEDRLVALIEPDETRLIALRDAWDDEREAERQAKLAAEKARVDAIRRKIDEIKACPAESVGHPSASLAAVIELMERHEVTLEEFAEFAGEAEMAKVAALARLGEMLTAQQAHEAEQARIAAERAQLAKEREEAAERERQAAAERQRIADEERIARAKAHAAMLAEQQAHEARLRAEREAAEAELRKQREAEEARLAEQRAELARQQAAIDAANAERERVEREAREAAEAEARAEAQRIADEQAAEEAAAEAERQRRERVQFELNGPGDVEIVTTLALEYATNTTVVVGWLEKFNAAAFKSPTEKAA
ncbi:hypothetical protein SAMN05216466_107143 [Paraburkholderia phenazinium]|uniref:Uncharacterized protein n=1 Tax=Paraburkholderia phenazinium TaxID=60549 RepID=A0A1G7ZRC6_9BURK|nr:hypothetical protein [Paraburkholderia phenazinium]SDH11249.1 hypothetical protein SAMN05216466_107143 [Paraburkholderia phenazinium]